MTFYGAGRAAGADVNIHVEVRSVNHRFLDTQVRLPRDYMALEAQVVSAVKAVFTRGRVEVFVRRDDAAAGAVHVDHAVARRFAEQLRSLKDQLGVAGEVDLGLILAQPGVVTNTETEREAEADWPVLEQALTAALERANDMSKQEGEALNADMAARLDSVAALHQEIINRSAEQVERYRARLQERVADLLQRAGAGELDQGRLLQEVAHLADRTDIAEEITRMASHLDQCRALLSDGVPVGRKLDFLLQELFRETNTIASKTPIPEVKDFAVDIKVELERVREQVQNVE